MNFSQLSLRAATDPSADPPNSAPRRKAVDITATPDRANITKELIADDSEEYIPSPPRGFQGPTKSTKSAASANPSSITKQSLAEYYANLRAKASSTVAEAYTVLTPLRARRATDNITKDTDSTGSVPSTSAGSETPMDTFPFLPAPAATPTRLLAPNGRLPSRGSPINTAIINITDPAQPNTSENSTTLLNHDTATTLTTADNPINTDETEDLYTKPHALPDAEFRRLRLLSQTTTHHSPAPTGTLEALTKQKHPPSSQKQSSLEASFAKAVTKSLHNRLSTPLPNNNKQQTTLPSALRKTNTSSTKTSTTKTTTWSPTETDTTEEASPTLPTSNDDDLATLHPTTMRPVRRNPRRSTTDAPLQTALSTPPPAAPLTITKPSTTTTTNTTRSNRKQPNPPAPVLTHDFHSVVVLIVRVDAENSFDNFLDSMADTISFIQRYVDTTAAFLPKPGSPKEFGPISSRETCPEVQFVMIRHYLDSKNPYAFSNGKPKTTKAIRVSAILGTNEDPAQMFDAISGDLMRFNVSMTYKPFQALDTENRLVFLGAPQNANKHETEETIYRICSDVEARRRNLDPDGFPAHIHSGDFPRFAVVSEQPGGMPYVEKTASEKSSTRVGPPREQRTLQILCASSDYDRITRVVMAAKEEKHWTKEFGPSCHPTEVPTNEYSEAERQRYLVMVETHRSAQLSQGTVPISGLRDADKEITLRRLPDSKNKPQPAMQLNIKQVMRDMKFKGKLLWLCVLKADNGRYVGYFSSGDAVLTAYTQAFLLCPAAQVYFYLLKRGYLKADVDRLIRNTFNFEQQSLIAETRYNAETRLAYIKSEKDEFMDIISAAYNPETAVDPSAGLSDAQLKLRQAQSEVVVGTLKAGAINYYNFDDGQSITTIHTRAAADDDDNSIATKSIGDTRFEPDDSEDDNDDDLIPTNLSSSVQFTGLEHLTVEPPAAQNNVMDTIDRDLDTDTLGEEQDTHMDDAGTLSFATEMWKQYAGDADDMKTVINILLTEHEIADNYEVSDSVIPKHLRELLFQETKGDTDLTRAYLLSIRESVEAGITDANISESLATHDEELAFQLQLLEDEAALTTAGLPATTAAAAANLGQPRGRVDSVGTSRPGVEKL